MSYMQISKQAVNFSLKELTKRNFVTRKKDKVFIYTVNVNKISELLEDYKIKSNLKID
jgi:predicted transcriptional regulator